MTDFWYYTHANVKHGPVSAQQLRQLAATGGLAPHDLIWPESTETVPAVRADAALPFPSSAGATKPPASPAALPDWVRALKDAALDVPTLESLPPPPAKDWLGDVGRIAVPPRPARGDSNRPKHG